MIEPLSDYERLGGHPGLEVLLNDLVQRMAKDFIAGWLFEGRDLGSIATHEVDFAAAHLGGPRAYRGRPIGPTHQALPINPGLFRRRIAMLQKVLEDHHVAPDIAERWVAHDQRLERAITSGPDCAPSSGDLP